MEYLHVYTVMILLLKNNHANFDENRTITKIVHDQKHIFGDIYKELLKL